MEETSREGSGKEDMSEFFNLTAEIESFVRTADTDKEKLRDSPEKSTSKIPATTVTTTALITTQTERIQPEQSKPIPKPKPIKQDATTSTTTPSPKPTTITRTTAIIETKPRDSPEKKQINTNQTEIIEIRTIITETKEPSPEIIRLPSSNRVSPENNEEYQTPEREITPVATSTPTKSIQKASSEKQLNITPKTKPSPPKIIIRSATEDANDFLEQHPLPPAPTHTVTTPRSTEVEFILEEQHEIVRTFHTPQPQSIDELKITESIEDLTKKETKLSNTQNATTPTKSTTEPDADGFRVRFVPLKNFTPEPIRRDLQQKPINKYLTKNTEHGVNGGYNGFGVNGTAQKNGIPPKAEYDDDSDVVVIVQKKIPPAPPKRRRSVRDIIASINKSQSLLKINQDAANAEKQQYTSLEQIPQYAGQPLAYAPLSAATPLSAAQPTPSNESIVRNINDLQNSDKQIKQMISEMENASTTREDVNHIPVMVEKFDEFNNEEMFKKCVVRRDKSGMDWNPLPKPRRSRNLTHEAELGKL